MTNKNIYKCLGGIDPELIMNAAPAEKVQKKNSSWAKWALLAACFFLILSAVIVIPMLREDDPGIIPITGVETTVSSSKGEIILPSPPEYSSYEYESYSDVYKALTDSLDPQFIKLRLEQENCGELYQQTLSAFASGEIKVALPQINGENISLRNNEGFSSVVWFTNELYNLPWLWYHCLVNEQYLTVNIAYLNVIDRTELDSAKTYYQVLKMIAPNAPSPDNYKQYENYKNIYEKEITLKTGEKVTAMIKELKNNSKIYVSLYLDGMLVTLRGDETLLTDEFFQTFGIAYME